MSTNTKITGIFEEHVLRSVLKLGSNAYGVPIGREIESTTHRRVSTGALYTTLSRLEKKGFISSWWGEPIAERGGRKKRFFRIEASGREALRAADAAREFLGLVPAMI